MSNRITRRLTIDVTATPDQFGRTGESLADELAELITSAGVTMRLVDSTATPPYRLHAGMTAMDYLLNAEQNEWLTDGDGWNSWGEAPGTESNDTVTIHVMWYEPVTVEQANAIVEAHRSLLAPMTTERDTHCIASVSDADVWSESQDWHWYDNVADPQDH